ASRIIRRTVVNASNGNPLVGVSVSDAATKSTAASGEDGTFEISSQANSTLTFKYIGFDLKTVVVGNQSQIRVELNENESELDEEVVVAFGSSKKKDLTGSVSSISTESIEKSQISTISRAFEGAVPGV